MVEELLAWDVIERAPDGSLSLTRRFRAGLARAARQLQPDEAAARIPGSEAMRRAAALALVQHPRPPGAVLRAEHASFVAGVELASLPDALRGALGG